MFDITEQIAQHGGLCPVCGKYFQPNGVGPMSIPMISTALDKLPSSHLLRYGANFHDWLYHLGTAWGSRLQADDMMFNLNELRIRQKARWWNAWYYRAMNRRNYVFVREFGDQFWNDKGCL